MAQTKTATAGVELAWVEDFAQRWLDAWNSHDPDRLLALMTEDVVYDDSASPRTMRGHGDVRPFLDLTWRAFPDMRFEPVGEPLLAPTEPRAAFWWRGTATHTGPIEPPGLAPTGKRLQFEGADFHEYRDGKVARLQIVFDMADFLTQLGVLPAPGSRGQQVMAKLASLQTRLRR